MQFSGYLGRKSVDYGTFLKKWTPRFLRGDELSEANYHNIKFVDLIFGELPVLGIISTHSHFVFLLSDNSM